MMEKVVEGETEIEGPSHPHTIESKELLENWKADKTLSK